MKVNNMIGITQNATVNPLHSIGDGIIRIIVAMLIPTPFVRELIVAFKKPLLVMLLSIVVSFVGVLLLLVQLLAHPYEIVSVGDVLRLLPGGGETVLSSEQIQSLQGYIAAGFSDTEFPNVDPLGGSHIVTAHFQELSYFTRFGMHHTGIDLVPGTAYSLTEAYQLTGQIIVFATMNGTATSYTDSYGALTVDVVNSQGTHKTVYKHLKQIISDSGAVRAGQPIGVMGSTGFSTGEHLHYEVQINDGGRWIAVNPAGYF